MLIKKLQREMTFSKTCCDPCLLFPKKDSKTVLICFRKTFHLQYNVQLNIFCGHCSSGLFDKHTQQSQHSVASNLSPSSFKGISLKTLKMIFVFVFRSHFPIVTHCDKYCLHIKLSFGKVHWSQ